MTKIIPNNPLPPPKSHLIFDFDGTLIDSFACLVTVFNELALTHHFRQIKPEEITMLKNTDSKTLMRLYQIPIYKIPIIIYQAAQQMRNVLLTLQPFAGMPQTISKLHEAGYRLSIVSSNSEQNVKTWLEHHHLMHFFHHIQHAPYYYGKSKTLKQVLKQTQHTKEKTCYIGDETRDIEAAKQTGIDCMSVTWGFHSETLLMQYQPQYLAYHPADILTAFLGG
ncbi:MAG: HAD-IA family hydrolase [Legionellales bacterium]|nr:HAD-IA family hydrolase [Legionellales bacterium]